MNVLTSEQWSPIHIDSILVEDDAVEDREQNSSCRLSDPPRRGDGISIHFDIRLRITCLLSINLIFASEYLSIWDCWELR